jgi:hypothetical protein
MLDLDPNPEPESGTESRIETVMHSGSGFAKAKSYGFCGSGSGSTTLSVNKSGTCTFAIAGWCGGRRIEDRWFQSCVEAATIARSRRSSLSVTDLDLKPKR